MDTPGVPEMEGRSYQNWMVAQPVKLGGCGLRSMADTRFPAFMGGVEMSIPYLVEGEHGGKPICPQLEDVVGSMVGPQRWTEFLAAGSRTAQEFRTAWDSLATEARNIWGYLGEEPTGPLAATVEEAGGSSIDGSTRTKVVQQREGLRHQLLTKALVAHTNREARPVTAFPNIADDKCAGRWLLATPGPSLGMSTPVFREALSSHLCLPSPAIRDGRWEGKQIGKRGEVVDKFGDAVMNCNQVCGDTWRRRHDSNKQHVVHEAIVSGVQVDCEVYGLFSDLLPAVLEEEGGELQWGRSRQGIVPDFKLFLNTPEGPVSCLAELKMISAGKTWYPRGEEGGKGTDRRAAVLTGEYEAKLRKYDVRYHGCAPRQRGQPEPPPGPLVSRLRNYGRLRRLVAGPWGDLSADFHELLREFAVSRVASKARARGWEGGDGELGKAMGDVRRATSVTVVRAQALCLLERLTYLSPGARGAVERRRLAERLQERRTRESQAYTLSHLNRGLNWVGRTFVPHG